MKDFKKYILFLIGILVLVLGVSLFLLLPRNGKNNDKCLNEQCLGISGYSPVGFPNSTEEQIKEYWKDINKYAEIYGVHTELSSTSLLDMASKNLNIPISLVISDKDLSDLSKIYEVLDKNPKIMYLGIGNEINNLPEEEYLNFLNEAKIKFPKIKEKYPNIKIMTVFQYESFIGKGYLTGKNNPNNLDMLKDWESLVDVYGFTVYPFLDYRTPREIPDDYFGNITKDFVITETSWPSAINLFNGKERLFNTDVNEQKEYVEWFFSIKDNSRLRFVNWLMLNDISDIDPIFQGAGLRNSDGSIKPAFGVWTNPS
jgi:hypothetical protein